MAAKAGAFGVGGRVERKQRRVEGERLERFYRRVVGVVLEWKLAHVHTIAAVVVVL